MHNTIEVSVESRELPKTQRRAAEVIAANLNENIIDNLFLDTDFTSINVDSISFIKMIVSLEREFNFEFDDEMLLMTKLPTVKSMIKYVEMKAKTSCESC